MSRNVKIILLGLGICAAMIGTLALCANVFSTNTGTPAPTSTGTPAPTSTWQEEQQDCDDEDRSNRKIEDCGIGVLLEPGKPKPVVTTKVPAPVVTRCTRTVTRRC